MPDRIIYNQDLYKKVVSQYYPVKIRLDITFESYPPIVSAISECNFENIVKTFHVFINQI